MKVNAKLVESNASNDDLTQRLATLENKLQRAIAEKDSYLEENKVCDEYNLATFLKFHCRCLDFVFRN